MARASAPRPAPVEPAAEPLPVDPRHDCGFGPCPLQPCEFGNYADQPVCLVHFNAYMATVLTDEPPRDGETLATPTPDAEASTTTGE